MRTEAEITQEIQQAVFRLGVLEKNARVERVRIDARIDELEAELTVTRAAAAALAPERLAERIAVLEGKS